MHAPRAFASSSSRLALVAAILVGLFLPAGSFGTDSMPIGFLPDIDPPQVRHSSLPAPLEDDVFTDGLPWTTLGDGNPHPWVRVGRFVLCDRLRFVSHFFPRRPKAVSVFLLASLFDSMLLSRPPPPVSFMVA